MLWAADTWEPRDDKIAHFALSAWVSHLLGWPIALVLGVIVEAVEWWRYERWLKRGAPSPWPFLTDRPSYKDLAYNLAGALLGRVVP